jgi:hypothetical protein
VTQICSLGVHSQLGELLPPLPGRANSSIFQSVPVRCTGAGLVIAFVDTVSAAGNTPEALSLGTLGSRTEPGTIRDIFRSKPVLDNYSHSVRSTHSLRSLSKAATFDNLSPGATDSRLRSTLLELDMRWTRGTSTLLLVIFLNSLLARSLLSDDLSIFLLLGSQKRFVGQSTDPHTSNFVSGKGKRITYIFVNGPVKYVVILEAFTDEKVPEYFAQVRVVRLIIETQRTGVIEVDGELIGEATAENLSGSSHFLLHDPIVFLLFSGSLESLPRKRSPTEVQHHVAQGLHIVTTGLFCDVKVSNRAPRSLLENLPTPK